MTERSSHARGPLGPAQSGRRSVERRVRRRVVALVRCVAGSCSDAASRLDLSPRTVASWARSWHARTLHAADRGRPPSPVDPCVQEQVGEIMATHARAVGVPALKALFPAVARSRLEELRDLWCDDHRPRFERLCWTTPGSVWSTDFTHGPCLIDGVFPSLLLVRDLASRVTLLALPCTDESARAVAASLERLFILHGPPLVLKSDNGSPFTAEVVADVLAKGVVTHLRSPVYTPRYNGSVESTGGCLKARAAQIAGCSGRWSCWSSDDIEAARLAANAFNRPWGVLGSTPDQRWDARTPICQERRALFMGAVDRFRASITRSWLERHHALNPGAMLAPEHVPAVQRSSVDRAAIRSALVELGELTIGRPANTSTHSTPKTRRD